MSLGGVHCSMICVCETVEELPSVSLSGVAITCCSVLVSLHPQPYCSPLVSQFAALAQAVFAQYPNYTMGAVNAETNAQEHSMHRAQRAGLPPQQRGSPGAPQPAFVPAYEAGLQAPGGAAQTNQTIHTPATTKSMWRHERTSAH